MHVKKISGYTWHQAHQLWFAAEHVTYTRQHIKSTLRSLYYHKNRQ